MKIAIFSDTHLTEQFDLKLFEQLESTVSSVDRVIINGDFWDGYLTTFDKFITSPWKQLFPLLKEKKTIYIYGNHDANGFCDQRVSLFSVKQTLKHHFHIGKYTYHIQHGHLIESNPITSVVAILPHSWSKVMNMWIDKQEKNVTFFGKIATLIADHFDVIGDRKLREYIQKYGSKNPYTYYVFGHTHTPRFSSNGGYLNPGRFSVHTPQYLLIEGT